MIEKTVLLVLFTLVLGCSNKKVDTPTTVLKGAKIFIGNGNVIKNGVVIINKGIIMAIGGKETLIPDNAEVIDVAGKFITPGLVDAHVHFSQTGFFDGRRDVLDITDSIDYVKVQERQKKDPYRYYEAYLRSGVTAVYDVGGFSWSLDLQKTAENNLNAPHIAASGLLLTPNNKKDNAVNAALNTPTDSMDVSLSSGNYGRRIVRYNDGLGATGIKIITLALKDTAFMKNMIAVKDEIAKRGNKMIVHATKLEQAKQALRFDAKILVHSVEDQPIDEEFIQLAKASNIIYCPTLIVSRGYLNAFKSLKSEFEINDPNHVIDIATKNLLRSSNNFHKYLGSLDLDNILKKQEQQTENSKKIMFDNLKRIHQEGIIIALGSDAGNPGTLHGISIYDELEAMQSAGIPAKEIIQMATKNGALAMDRLHDFGTLEKGKMADLIILAKNPATDISNMRSITHVMRGGFLRPVNEAFETKVNRRYKE
jgi:imidazolonepropionase-like amidohydrolase